MAAPLNVNGGLVTAAATTNLTNGATTALYCSALTMTGGTINGTSAGGSFAFNGPVTINPSATPSVISANTLYLDNVGGRLTSYTVNSDMPIRRC